MRPANEVAIQQFDFNEDLFHEFQDLHYAKEFWPLVYILSDGKIKEAYVGETTDAYARMSSHLRNEHKQKLTAVHLITSEKFNKSATLDIESNLIKYISADGQYKLLNANIGLANHNYYQKQEVYWHIFKTIWHKLTAKGLTKHSIEYIDNSDLFKYSPYKSLSREQLNGLMTIINCLLSEKHDRIVVEGGAGTGKTILAVFLFKLINSDNEDFNFKEFGEDETEFIERIRLLKEKFHNPKMALVVPMSSFRNTLKKVFKNIQGLNANMVVGPAEIANQKYDITLVDESHRLRRRVNLGAYFGSFDKACEKLGLDKHNCNELDWMLMQAKKLILFYDENQSIKPSDVPKKDFDYLKAQDSTKNAHLKSQFRVKGGNSYIDYVTRLLKGDLRKNEELYQAKHYELTLYDSIEELVAEIKLKNEKHGLSRLIAGYSWKWISKKNADAYDIHIEKTQLKWNRVSDDWINSENSMEEVGCIHTTQGYDLNYTGIIFGHEITYNKDRGRIEIIKENYHDKNGKNSIRDEEELRSFIINIYQTILLRGIKGTYVYVCDANLREYFAQHIAAKYTPTLSIDPIELIPFENCVPLYNLQAAAGDFSEPQNVDDFDWVPLPSGYNPSKDLFACTVIGESMNKIIPNGSVCLFRKYSGGSRDGKIVLCEHTSIQDPDFGSGYTIKEYRSKKHIDGEQWRHASIVLKPVSFSDQFQDIEIVADELNSFRTIGIFECVIEMD
ncbi:MAG: DNA/RNA helicase domain-containing protein [Saprospiraceae bacterium]